MLGWTLYGFLSRGSLLPSQEQSSLAPTLPLEIIRKLQVKFGEHQSANKPMNNMGHSQEIIMQEQIHTQPLHSTDYLSYKEHVEQK